MAAPLQLIARLALVVPLFVSIAPTPQAPEAQEKSAIAALPPEVRLRKLHLVRPDLIPYPIAYEVCC
jgi:hypothetical protein